MAANADPNNPVDSKFLEIVTLSRTCYESNYEVVPLIDGESYMPDILMFQKRNRSSQMLNGPFIYGFEKASDTVSFRGF